jgi:hypothetical protein
MRSFNFPLFVGWGHAPPELPALRDGGQRRTLQRCALFGGLISNDKTGIGWGARAKMRLRQYGIIVLVALMTACTSGFRIERTGGETYVITDAVEWIDHEPARPYVVIARFRGAELALCAPAEPYCSLRKEALRLGANAVWVQQKEQSTRPEQWVNIRGQMTRIREAPYETIEGVLIRYR